MKANKELESLHKKLLKRYKEATNANSEERQRMRDDQRFAAGEQWPEEARKAREIQNRPIITVNRIPAFIDQITGDARQNKPAIRVLPGEDGDQAIAEIYQGIIRAIEYQSNADFAYDTALEHASTWGFGAWRVKTIYADNETFNQEIVIETIPNPLNVHFDPHSIQADYSDAEYCFVDEYTPLEEYKAKWPKAEPADFDSNGLDAPWQVGDDDVLITEHWYKETKRSMLYLYEDGTTSNQKIEGLVVAQEREIDEVNIYSCIASGHGLIEGPTLWAGTIIPIVGVKGKEDLIDGRRFLRGIVRFAKDPQRMYNYWRTMDTETKALQPKVPWLLTAKQISGYEQIWNRANAEPLPYLIYNSDSEAGAPARNQTGSMDNSAERAALLAVDELKSTTGIFSASLGEQGNETSGRAILARQSEGDTATFAYIDNQARAIRYTGRVIAELIPKIYDTQRTIQILGDDGERQVAQINQPAIGPSGEPVLMNDLSVGKYDVIVDVGPSFKTKRTEAVNTLVELATRMPPEMALPIAVMVFKNLDIPEAEKLYEISTRMMPPGMIDGEQGQQQPQIPPELIQQIQQASAEMEQLRAENEELQRKIDDKTVEYRLRMHDIETEYQAKLYQVDQAQQAAETKAIADIRIAQMQTVAKAMGDGGCAGIGVDGDYADQVDALNPIPALHNVFKGMTDNQQAMMQQFAKMMAQASAPRRVVRDAEGNVIGVEVVVPEDVGTVDIEVSTNE